MNQQTKKPIQCHVVEVNKDVTSCQETGNTFIVDDQLQGKLCPAAQALVEAAAEKMNGGPADAPKSSFLDVPCPDNHVTYRLSRVDAE
ncbi:MAG: hypothetical protein HQ559_14010 [Lentisphaerae bacterium]|nr:hypothetical protein [Lentisphaerota bacterium]